MTVLDLNTQLYTGCGQWAKRCDQAASLGHTQLQYVVGIFPATHSRQTSPWQLALFCTRRPLSSELGHLTSMTPHSFPLNLLYLLRHGSYACKIPNLERTAFDLAKTKSRAQPLEAKLELSKRGFWFFSFSSESYSNRGVTGVKAEKKWSVQTMSYTLKGAIGATSSYLP